MQMATSPEPAANNLNESSPSATAMKIPASCSPASIDWMSEVASSGVLDSAFAWLCQRRID